MWKCSECGVDNQGLFCTNCGAPMTEEGEKLNVTPETQEISENESSVSSVVAEDGSYMEEQKKEVSTFRGLIRKAVTSNQYLVFAILLTVGVAVKTFFLNSFDILSILVIISLYLARDAVKSDSEDKNKVYSLANVAIKIKAILTIVGVSLLVLSMLFLALANTLMNNVVMESMKEGVSIALAFKDGKFVMAEMNQPEIVEAYVSFCREINMAPELLGQIISENLESILAVISLIFVGYVVYTVFFVVVNFKISKMLKFYDLKFMDDTTPLYYSGFAVTMVQISGIVSVVVSVLTFNILSVLSGGLIGVSYFFLAKMMKDLNKDVANLEASNV